MFSRTMDKHTLVLHRQVFAWDLTTDLEKKLTFKLISVFNEEM